MVFDGLYDPVIRFNPNDAFLEIPIANTNFFRHFAKSLYTFIKYVKDHETFVGNTSSYLLPFRHKSRRTVTGGISDVSGGTSGRFSVENFQSPTAPGGTSETFPCELRLNDE